MARGLLQYVGENAPIEADSLDAQATEWEKKAAEARELASALRDLAAIASRHMKPATLELVPEAA